MRKRLALSVPVADHSVAELPDIAREAESLGYTDAWSGETDSTDIFTPLAAIALATEMRVGTAIVNAYTRGPAALAATAASFADLIPGRFVLGIGSGSKPIVERWNGGRFEKPLTRVREMAIVVRQMLSGERVVFEGKTMNIDGYRLIRPPSTPVPIHIAALRPGMLQIAGEVGDGAILNWLSADDARRATGIAKDAAKAAGKDPEQFEIGARLFVDIDPVEPVAGENLKRWVTQYLNVPTYRAFHEWLGRGEVLGPMFDAWDTGDRKRALDEVPEPVVNELFLRGTPEERRAHLQRYFDAGVDTAYVTFFTKETDPALRREKIRQAIRDMAG